MIFMFTGLHILEFVRPEVFLTHDPASQFLDRLIQIPTMLVVSFLIRHMTNRYEQGDYVVVGGDWNQLPCFTEREHH